MPIGFLDPSTQTGWAICEPFRDRPKMRVGSWDLPKGTNAERAAALAKCVYTWLREERIERLGVELPMSAPPRPVKKQVKTALGFETQMVSQGSLQTQALLWALHGAIAGAAALARVPLHPVGMKQWRAHTLGNGNIAGIESKRRCKQLLESLDVYCRNQNAAEAGGGALWMLGQMDKLALEERIRA